MAALSAKVDPCPVQVRGEVKKSLLKLADFVQNKSLQVRLRHLLRMWVWSVSASYTNLNKLSRTFNLNPMT